MAYLEPFSLKSAKKAEIWNFCRFWKKMAGMTRKTTENDADIFTKNVSGDLNERHVKQMMHLEE